MAFVFPRTGAQIKNAAGRRRQQLSERLEAREATLDDFLNDRQGVRSYILRTANGPRCSFSSVVTLRHRSGRGWPGPVTRTRMVELSVAPRSSLAISFAA